MLDNCLMVVAIEMNFSTNKGWSQTFVTFRRRDVDDVVSLTNGNDPGEPALPIFVGNSANICKCTAN